MTDLEMNYIFLPIIREHCYNFALWAIQQGYASKEELDEVFSDEFDDRKADIGIELRTFYNDVIKAFPEEEQEEEDYDPDEE